MEAALADLKGPATDTSPDVVPEGWKTTDQWAALTKPPSSVSVMGRKLRKLVNEKTWEMKKFRVLQVTGRTYLTPHYRKKP